jgi:hypothetical protein
MTEMIEATEKLHPLLGKHKGCYVSMARIAQLERVLVTIMDLYGYFSFILLNRFLSHMTQD